MSNKYPVPEGGWTVDNFPFVDVKWIAKQVGLTPGVIRRYITERNPRLVPDVKMPEGMKGYFFSRQRALEWIEAYKAAPKRGRRGDGSKQRKVTARMRQIVAWMKANDGYIMCSASGDEINEIEVVSTQVDGDSIVSKFFGSITDKTLERLCKAGLVEETDHPIRTRKDSRIVEITTYYRLKDNGD